MIPQATILVVEDDASIQRALASLLDDEGYRVSTASDGAEALTQLARDAAPDLILLDLRLPVMDGWSFRVAQRRDSRLAAIPVVAISADGSAHAEAISAAAFLHKPFNAADVLSAIRRVLSEGEAHRLSSPWRHTDRLVALGRMAAGVGHEINNPLAFVTLNVNHAHDRLQQVVDSPDTLTSPVRSVLCEATSLLSDATMGLERIRGTVSQLQRLSRKPGEEADSFDVRMVLDESIAMASNQLRHRARVTKRYGQSPSARGSASSLGQVFLNLLINAGQAIAEGDAANNEIEVTTSFNGTHVSVEIRDTGSGIPADVLPHVFEPFFTTKSIEKGTGLGLAICQQIVDDQGGRLTLESEVGRGTVCRVYLHPTAQTASTRSLPSVPEPEAATPTDQSRGRILVVDDEVLIGRVITSILSARHDVIAVETAREAFGILEEGEHFDLVLCDLLMPNVTGPQVHATLASRWPELLSRLIFMTGGAFSPEADEFLSRCGSQTLGKPFTPDELRNLVEAKVGQGRRHALPLSARGSACGPHAQGAPDSPP